MQKVIVGQVENSAVFSRFITEHCWSLCMIFITMLLAFVLFFSMLFGQGIISISDEVIDLFQPTITDDICAFYIDHFRISCRENSLSLMLISVLVFMIFTFVLIFVLFTFVLISIFIAMKRNTIDALDTVDRDAEVAPIACFRDAQSQCIVLKIRIRQEPYFFFMLIFVLVIVVLTMKYGASWNIKIIELRILIRKTEIQTAKIILVRKVMAITVINRLRLQTEL